MHSLQPYAIALLRDGRQITPFAPAAWVHHHPYPSSIEVEGFTTDTVPIPPKPR